MNMNTILIGIAGTIGLFLTLGLIARRIHVKALIRQMPEWFPGDLITLNSTSAVLHAIVKSEGLNILRQGLILTGWNEHTITVQTVSALTYVVPLSQVHANVSVTRREVEVTLKQFKAPAKKTPNQQLNPKTCFDGISIYSMDFAQLQKALKKTTAAEDYELAAKIKTVLDDKYIIQ